ncbi:Hypothetical predicted protein [Olea europaea subsp. europaea]|uniref:Uncharacterized protein n=1 Tax=Olea europaea subsp. europaea TaxID=158383 RepID=A0A8S0SMI5_OLEEU|nr:Hypothetical predicted protein [Olea europaea subsp. europaea]
MEIFMQKELSSRLRGGIDNKSRIVEHPNIFLGINEASVGGGGGGCDAKSTQSVLDNRVVSDSWISYGRKHAGLNQVSQEGISDIDTVHLCRMPSLDTDTIRDALLAQIHKIVIHVYNKLYKFSCLC